mmetsp:Transcript_44709/g.72559  ORF Transcript_44709/g.72559 Transcript_44709/m.72559 type:complete len:218 (+) Transcript_44709:943-1596(+)
MLLEGLDHARHGRPLALHLVGEDLGVGILFFVQCLVLFLEEFVVALNVYNHLGLPKLSDKGCGVRLRAREPVKHDEWGAAALSILFEHRHKLLWLLWVNGHLEDGSCIVLECLASDRLYETVGAADELRLLSADHRRQAADDCELRQGCLCHQNLELGLLRHLADLKLLQLAQPAEVRHDGWEPILALVEGPSGFLLVLGIVLHVLFLEGHHSLIRA